MKIVIETSEEFYEDCKRFAEYNEADKVIANGYQIDEQRIIKDICIGGSTDDLCDHNCTECEVLEITPKALFESIRRKRNEDSD